jgi:hypothetical protein
MKLDTRGIEKLLPGLIAKLPEGHALRNAFLTVLAEEDVKVAQKYYDRLIEAYGANVDLLTMDSEYLLNGVTAISQVDTYGLENVVAELARTLPDGDRKKAFKTILAETDLQKLKIYYKRLADCWGSTGRIDNIDPEYLLGK